MKRETKKKLFVARYVVTRVAKNTARATRRGVDILAELGLWVSGFNVGGCLATWATGTWGAWYGPLVFVAAGAISWLLTLWLADTVLFAYGKLRDEAEQKAEHRFPEVAPEPGDLALLEE